MGTKLNPGEYDCYAAAEPDEPMFVLLARDKYAPTLTWLWSVLRGLEDPPDTKKMQEAQQCVAAMIAWQAAKGGQVAGLGQSALAAVLELIRMANWAVKQQDIATNEPTGEDFMRRILCETKFDAKSGPV